MSRTVGIPLEAALVRVWRGDTPLGAGFLAGPREVVTAAHVAAGALEVPADGPAPPDDATVEIDFPLVSPGDRCAARVVAWVPLGTDRTGDIAGLRVLDPLPDGAGPLVLTRFRGLATDQLVMVGFPRGLELGSWVHGRRGGPVATGWVEINSEPGQPAELLPGFSGSPVWGPELDAAVGMVAQRVRNAPPKIGYLITVDTLLSAWPELAELIERAPPFRALRPFTEQDSHLFFGRAEQSAKLAGLARSEPVLCVVGPSGVGKSSLLHAGVLPRLSAEPGQVVAVLRPSDASTPTRALAVALDRLLHPDGSPMERLERVDRLATRLYGGGVADVVGAVLAECAGERLLVAVDQFEELFGFPAAEQAAFTGVLAATRRTGARWSVLLNLRDTFLGAALRTPATLELAGGWWPHTVAALTSSELREAITRPLTAVGTVDYESGLVERLLEDVQSAPGSLPLLQFTLTQLWERRSAGLLRHDAYDELGGVRGALARYAEQVWAGLDPATQAEATRLLAQLVRPLPEDRLWVRRTANRDELDDRQWTVAQRLAGSRLLVLRGTPASGVELAHESLVDQWPRLRELAERYRDFRVWQDGMRQRMARWTEEGSSRRRLLSGEDLRDANRWAKRNAEDISAAEHAYLALSNRRRRRTLATVAAVLVVAVVATVLAFRTTGEQRAELAAANLADKAARLRQYDAYGSLQLALRAYRTDPDVDLGSNTTRRFPGIDRLLPDYTMATTDTSAPSQSSSRSGTTERLEQGVQVAGGLSTKVSADGTRMVTANSAGQPVLWTIDHGQVRATSLDHLFTKLASAQRPTISRSGRLVAFVQTVFPEIPTDVHGPVDEEGLPKVDPNDYPTCEVKSVASVLTCLVVYDVDAGKVRLAVPLGGAGTLVTMLGMDPDERVVTALQPGSLAEPTDNTLRRWDLRTGDELAPVHIPWHSLITGLWLRHAATSAFVREFTPGEPDQPVLSVVDLGSVPTRRKLVSGALDVAMSLDWSTVAATESTPDGSVAGVTVLDTGSLTRVAHVTGLSAQERHGTISLSRNGSELLLSWATKLDTAPTDVRETADYTHRMSVWSVPGGERLRNDARLDPYWPRVVPLGDGLDGPLVLYRTSLVGLVLPRPGEPDPLRRLTDAEAADTTMDTDDLVDRLCGLLADPETDNAVRGLVPQDAYGEELCPS